MLNFIGTNVNVCAIDCCYFTVYECKLC